MSNTAAGQAEVGFLGLRFASMREQDALAWIAARRDAPAFAYLVTPNVDHVVRLARAARDGGDAMLWPAYEEADLRLCDSRILALLARWSGIDLPVVAGSDLTARLLGSPLPAGTRIALIGGNEPQRRWLAAAQPQAEVAQHQPPMGLRTNPAAQLEVARFIEQARPHLTLLTVGAPQSELVAQLVKRRGQAGGVALCVGASLEFLTGEKRRAPRLWQAARLEWAYRLLSEPRRLWRRYLVEGPAIFAIWWRWRSRAADDAVGTGSVNDPAR
ncbi:MAG: WecB/TagA/CpsF family glycosyltransferase [Sphingomonadales bacterium]|nr:WecB/TagA/CpsF family glycosyltransferase [Sphingomonadales bacterium]